MEEIIRFAATNGGGYLFELTTWTLTRGSSAAYWYGILDDVAMNLLTWMSLAGVIVDCLMTWALSNWMEEMTTKGFI